MKTALYIIIVSLLLSCSLTELQLDEFTIQHNEHWEIHKNQGIDSETYWLLNSVGDSISIVFSIFADDMTEIPPRVLYIDSLEVVDLNKFDFGEAYITHDYNFDHDKIRKQNVDYIRNNLGLELKLSQPRKGLSGGFMGFSIPVSSDEGVKRLNVKTEINPSETAIDQFKYVLMNLKYRGEVMECYQLGF